LHLIALDRLLELLKVLLDGLKRDVLLLSSSSLLLSSRLSS